MADCKNCWYRLALARKFDVHVDYRDCDKFDTDICEALNKPIDYKPPEGTKTITIKGPLPEPPRNA